MLHIFSLMNRMTDDLADERAAYDALLPRLIEEHGLGRHALFVGTEFVGAFATYRDALVRGYSQMRDGHFLVRRIAVSHETVHMGSPMEKLAHHPV